MAKPREASPNADESVATAIVHDLLGEATTRVVYDLDRFNGWANRLSPPPIARETHVSDLATRASRPKFRSASPTPTASGGRSRRRSRPSQGR